jgi:hypothetical protein
MWALSCLTQHSPWPAPYDKIETSKGLKIETNSNQQQLK